MQLVQHPEVTNLFSAKYNAVKVVIEVLKDDKKLLCDISISEVHIGQCDISSPVSIGKSYKEFCKKFGNHKDKFSDLSEFNDLFLRIAEKLHNNDYIRESEKIKHELTPEAREFLLSPDLIDRMDLIERNSTRDPLIDSEDDLLIFNLVIISCKTERPITYEHTGGASSGKTFPAEHAVRGFPSSLILDPAGVSGKAMKYDYDYQDPETGYFINKTGGKCIYFREKEDSLDAVKFFKPMMSHDKETLEYKVTGRDSESGGSHVITYVLDGIASFILLSVKHMDDEEMSSRTMKGSPTVTREKTRKIIERTFESDANRDIWRPPKDLPMMHNAMYNLTKSNAINIFAPLIGKIFPKDDMRRARDMNRLRGLIQSCTVLHQYQRCYEIIDEKIIYYSSLEDNLVALILMDKLLESTVLGIPVGTLKIYDIMKDMEDRDVPLNFANIHEAAEASTMRMTMTDLKTHHVDILENHRFIKRKVQATKNRARSYAINKVYDDLSKVPKLTPLFIAEIQKTKQQIIKKWAPVFESITIPPIKQPLNTPRVGSDKLTNVIKHLFGFNYFHKSTIDNVLWKVTDESLKESLFSSEHIFKQEVIDISEQKEIIKHKRQAIKDIKSGKSAKEARKVITDADEELHKQHLEEEKQEREKYDNKVSEDSE